MDRNQNMWSRIRILAVVALRKESVDRNIILPPFMTSQNWSLSARRAWIEMFLAVWAVEHAYRRSPQGERG